MNPKQHINRWAIEINKYINLEKEEDIIRFCLSYTLQSLKAGEDFSRFRWDDLIDP